jgi:hypothetical protein
MNYFNLLYILLFILLTGNMFAEEIAPQGLNSLPVLTDDEKNLAELDLSSLPVVTKEELLIAEIPVGDLPITEFQNKKEIETSLETPANLIDEKTSDYNISYIVIFVISLCSLIGIIYYRKLRKT